MGSEAKNGRHPFRFIFKLLVFAGIIAAAGRFLVSKKEEYAGLTESEARAKMEAKLAPRFGDEKAEEIASQVIPVLIDRGLVKTDLEGAVDDLTDAAGKVAQEAADLVDETN